MSYSSYEQGDTHLIDAGNGDDSCYMVWYEEFYDFDREDQENVKDVLRELGYGRGDEDTGWNEIEHYTNGRYIDSLPRSFHVIRIGPDEDIIGHSMSYGDAVAQAIDWHHGTYPEED